MTEIPRSVIDAFTDQLNMISERHRTGLAEALAKIDMDADVATVRDQVARAMQVWCGGASDMSAMVAAEFYDGLRELCVGEPMGALVDGGRVPEATEGAVRAFVQDLVEGKAKEVFVDKCLDRLDYEVKRAAAECVVRNAERDPKRVRYARVPSGGETCPFCAMLASRGFVYHSEELASHAHAGCRCRVVPGWDGADSRVEGYDPNYWGLVWSGMTQYTIPDRKIAGYALKDENKARAFRLALGYTSENAALLTERLYAAVANVPPTYRDTTEYGERYYHDIVLDGLNGRSAKVRVGWILTNETGKMRLTTVFVDE